MREDRVRGVGPDLSEGGKRNPFTSNKRTAILKPTYKPRENKGGNDNTSSGPGLLKFSGGDSFLGAVVTFPTYALYGSKYQAWGGLNGYGASYSIFDSKNELYFEGTYCGKEVNATALCALSTLRPGQYTWRVTGALNSDKNEIAWDFCNVQGGASTQVEFEIDDTGKCSALDINVFSEVDISLESTEEGAVSGSSTTSKTSHVVTVQGSITFNSIGSDSLSASEEQIVKEVIAQELQAISSKSAVQANDVVLAAPLTSTRASVESLDSIPAATFTTVDFSVPVDVTLFGYDCDSNAASGSTSTPLAASYEGISDYLRYTMQFGIFTSDLIKLASDDGQSTRFTKLSLNDVSYGEVKLTDEHAETLVQTSAWAEQLPILILVALSVSLGLIGGLVVNFYLHQQSVNYAKEKEQQRESTVPDLPWGAAEEMPASSSHPQYGMDQSMHLRDVDSLESKMQFEQIHRVFDQVDFDDMKEVSGI